MNKACFKCGITKPLSDFYKHKQMADGHLNKCKECTKSDVHSHRHGKGRKKVLSYERDRAKTTARKDNAAKQAAKWLAAYPDRRRAQCALNKAVRDGRIVPLPCFCCGEKAEAHHPNYDAPLDVIWLCPAHHKQAHALVNKCTV